MLTVHVPDCMPGLQCMYLYRDLREWCSFSDGQLCHDQQADLTKSAQ